MKYIAIFLIVLVIAAGVLGILTYSNTRLQVLSVELSSVTGSSRESDFLALQSAMDNSALIGTPFTESLPGSASDYSFFTYTFRLKNKGWINAERVEIQVYPVNGDVLYYKSLNASDALSADTVSAGTERDLYTVLLTSVQNEQELNVSRSFRITYYIWGIPVTLTAQYN